MGTRGPKPWGSSVCGGGTWSHSPPEASQVTTMALVGHTEEACIWRMTPSSHFKPDSIDNPAAGCMLCSGPGWTKLTLGRWPTFKSVVNAARSLRLGEFCELVKNWNGFSCGT